jgi:O-antigen ligase
VQLCLVYFLLYREGDEAGRNPSPRNKRWVNILALAAAFLVVLLLGGQEMISRISTLKDPYGNSVGATRLLIARDCLKMFARHPLMGWGAGVFQEVYPSFRSFSTNLVVNAAHNDYLQLLVEYGLAGVAISVCFLWFAFRRFALLRLNWRDSWPHAVSFAALLGTVGILVHSLTDFNLQVPANATLFYVMCLVSSLPAPESIVSDRDPRDPKETA